MNRAERRDIEQRLRRRDPYVVRLRDEGLILEATGLLDEAGDVHCPECGAVLVRQVEGAITVFACRCGYRTELWSP